MFWENELFIPDIYLDGVVCVVDAKNVMNVSLIIISIHLILKSIL